MSRQPNVSLFDPILLSSSFINQKPTPTIATVFWKKFHALNFLCNIVIPLGILIFIMFVLKRRYLNKLHQKRTNDKLIHHLHKYIK